MISIPIIIAQEQPERYFLDLETMSDIVEFTWPLAQGLIQFLPLLCLGLIAAINFRRERTVLSERLSQAEKANAKLLSTLQRTVGEKDILQTELDNLKRQLLLNDQEHSQSDIKQSEFEQEVEEKDRLEENDHGEQKINIERASEDDQNDDKETDSHPQCASSSVDTIFNEENGANDDFVIFRAQETTTTEESFPSEELATPQKKSNALDSFYANPCYDTATRLLCEGIGSMDVAQDVFSKVFHILLEKRVEEADSAAKRALSSNDMEDLVRVSHDINTPNVRKVRRRLEVMKIDQDLHEAIQVQDCNALQAALDAAKSMNEREDSDSIEVPTESIEEAEEMLVKASTNLHHILSANPERTDPSKLYDALSAELWDWHSPSMEEEGNNKIGEDIVCGLHLLDLIQLKRDLSESISQKDFGLIKRVVHRAKLTCEKEEESLFASADCLSQIHETRLALEAAVRTETQLAEAITSFETLGGSLIEENSSHQMMEMFETEQKLCSSLATQAKKILYRNRMFERIKNALEGDDVELMRSVLEEYGQLQNAGWIQADETLHGLERAFKTKIALKVLQKGEDSRSLLDQAARLAFAEEMSLSLTSKLLLETKEKHQKDLCVELGSRFQLPSPEKMLTGLFIDRVDDLALLCEGDLRQAQVPRVLARKVLPELVKFGCEAKAYIVEAVEHFQVENGLQEVRTTT